MDRQTKVRRAFDFHKNNVPKLHSQNRKIHKALQDVSRRLGIKTEDSPYPKLPVDWLPTVKVTTKLLPKGHPDYEETHKKYRREYSRQVKASQKFAAETWKTLAAHNKRLRQEYTQAIQIDQGAGHDTTSNRTVAPFAWSSKHHLIEEHDRIKSNKSKDAQARKREAFAFIEKHASKLYGENRTEQESLYALSTSVGKDRSFGKVTTSLSYASEELQRQDWLPDVRNPVKLDSSRKRETESAYKRAHYHMQQNQFEVADQFWNRLADDHEDLKHRKIELTQQVQQSFGEAMQKVLEEEEALKQASEGQPSGGGGSMGDRTGWSGDYEAYNSGYGEGGPSGKADSRGKSAY
ncbi:hypothetical protein CI109_101540 [Kwoniella shandongensis]|uniref:Uncharacterized protein n=1 Tax=Kwoniella shandongensis TaxID=1734106 RepID=A0A5M6C5X9_9TREE|nr:uncharacterized protein CI109_001328 [Kwoniella shandongensis]KAA5530524.1 hypothetical protein CI109_001328 [Kwoniella shandongensis]